jgi:hypothetical protein
MGSLSEIDFVQRGINNLHGLGCLQVVGFSFITGLILLAMSP